jgi:hypothetical protein
MTHTKYHQLVELVRRTPKEAILQAVDIADGHSVYAPKAFTDVGLPAEVVAAFNVPHASDGSPKGTLFVDGKAVEQLTGVYGLRLLEFLAEALGVEYRRCLGRGFQAASIREAIRSHFEAQKPLQQ